MNQHLVKYLLIGSSNTVVSFALYYLLLTMKINYLVDNIICFIIGVLLGYTLNTIFVFKNKLNFKSLSKYTTVYIFSLLFNIIILFLLVHHLSIDKMLAQAITVGLITVVNYLLIKKFVFR